MLNFIIDEEMSYCVCPYQSLQPGPVFTSKATSYFNRVKRLSRDKDFRLGIQSNNYEAYPCNAQSLRLLRLGRK
jgi:hypothetical protein